MRRKRVADAHTVRNSVASETFKHRDTFEGSGRSAMVASVVREALSWKQSLERGEKSCVNM